MPWIVAAASIAISAGLGFGLYRATRPAGLKPLVRLDVDLGVGLSLGSEAGTDTIISPDGTRLVYVSKGKLFTRRMDQPKAIELNGTERAYEPFFSPDGQWVAFFTQSKLKKISVESGSVVELGTGASPRGGSWGEDGNIIAALTSWPQILPGGKAVLFTSHTSTAEFGAANIEVASSPDSWASHRRKTLIHGGTSGRYLPGSNGTGHLVYLNKGTLFAVPFDPEKLEVHGTPSPVLEEVAWSLTTGSAQFDFSRNGTLDLPDDLFD